LTTLTIVESAFNGAPGYGSCRTLSLPTPRGALKLSNSVIQALHASAHGKFATQGRYASAAVRGTKWTMRDRCDGTLTSVERGLVAVTDLRRHVTILVPAGRNYLARA
jgi:hypothetical protein